MENDVSISVANTAIEQGIPPSFSGNHWFYMMAIFGLMMMVLLAANWLWRIVWCFFEDPQPLRSPVTVFRAILALLLVTALLRGGPDAILLLRWPEISPADRLVVAETDRFLDGIALIPFFAAWLIEYLTAGVLQFQLKRLPPPSSDLWPTADSLKRPVQIAIGSFAVAFAVVFLQ
jgi:hypothetical protein